MICHPYEQGSPLRQYPGMLERCPNSEQYHQCWNSMYQEEWYTTFYHKIRSKAILLFVSWFEIQTKLWEPKIQKFLFVVLTSCQVQYLGPVQGMELSHQTQKEMTCPSQGQTVPDGTHGLMCRQCTCCPTLQALSVLDRSKSANLCSNMAIILKLSITSSFHQHNISDRDLVFKNDMFGKAQYGQCQK